MSRLAMSALRAHARGGAEQLAVDEVPIPEPRHDEVLVDVRAAGITIAELDWEETWTREGASRLPVIPAHEFSGAISKIGLGVSDLHPGDDVFGMVPFDQDGAAANFVRVPRNHLALKPRGLPYITAAAVPLAAMTAWQALVEHGHIHPGMRILVHGGAGSVGAMAVQFGSLLEAEMSATVRAPNLDYVRSLGAEAIEIEDFDRVAARFDIVVDTIGGEIARRSLRTLRKGGKLICLTGPAPDADRSDIETDFFIVAPQPSALTQIGRLVADDQLKVSVAAVFPLDRGREAYEKKTEPRRPGKTVISVREISF